MTNATETKLIWGCDCGETYDSPRAADQCRKCVSYLGHPTEEVVAVVPGTNAIVGSIAYDRKSSAYVAYDVGGDPLGSFWTLREAAECLTNNVKFFDPKEA